jgi:Tfp pilus assembly protein PilN
MRINLLPEQYRPEPPVNPLRLSILISCSLLLFGGLIWWGLQMLTLGNEEQILAVTVQQSSSYQPAMREITRYEQRLAALDKQLGQVQKIKAAYRRYPLVLKQLAGSLEADMWYDSISMQPTEAFDVKGKSVLFTTLAGLIDNLQALPDLTVVKLTQVDAVEREAGAGAGYYSFALKLKPGGGEAADAETSKAQNR